MMTDRKEEVATHRRSQTHQCQKSVHTRIEVEGQKMDSLKTMPCDP